MPSPSEHLGGLAVEKTLTIAVSHPLRSWVAALETLLEPRTDIDVVAAHTGTAWVRHAALTGQADLLLLSLEPGRAESLRMLPELFAAHPELTVVGLSESQDRALLFAAIQAGVRGWVEPTASVDHLVRVLHGVAAGETWFPPVLMTRVLDVLLQARERREQAGSVLDTLSRRELEILACLAKGLTRAQIAERYVLSPHTVRTHINNLLHKLDVHSTLAAVSVARRLGVVDPDALGPTA
ncbi:MAG TPA: response regulator transcription factor [Nocardioidaceae bacterium]|nr:response regulator transcription factor [Nocardioidaceae bacterium]